VYGAFRIVMSRRLELEIGQDAEPLPQLYAIGLPGQGGTILGAAQLEAKKSTEVAEIFQMANQVARTEFPDLSISQLVFHGPQEKLDETLVNHLANTAIYLAKYKTLQREHPNSPDPTVVVPSSMGECASLAISGVLSDEGAMKVALERGKATEKGGREFPGKMASILNLPGGLKMLDEICNEVSHEMDGIVSLSNINSENELVISGQEALVEAVIKKTMENRVRKAFMLPISFGSHCALMENAAAEFAEAIKDIEFADPKMPWVMNGEVVTTGAEIKERMVKGLTTTVNLKASLEMLKELGIPVLYEMVPKPLDDKTKASFGRFAGSVNPELQVLFR